ncbi:hypothetical protein MLD38_010431 [Melastoma candidum]|uniref:Uncharacterized protein n=1 Tax=Melastoma candidum TaxID=119954 RepID=A0ACB9R1L9_9MYRT|nr:hypothetical protein MLD38_010431 [Melastoma candidum]
MLGWLHQALALERELVLVLLEPDAVANRENSYHFNHVISHPSGVGHSLRRSRTTADSAQLGKSSVEAILSNSSTATASVQNGERPSGIFLINWLSAIRQPLLRNSVAAAYAKNLGDLINKHLHILVEKEVDSILRKCGLSDKMPLFHNALNNSHNRLLAADPLSDTLEMSPTVFAECVKAFFGLILGSDSSLPEFQQMQAPKLRSDASMEVLRTVTRIQGRLRGIRLIKSPDQIRTILGI